MNPKSTWMLAILAAGLFAFIYFFERNIKPPAPADLHVLAGLKADEITDIQIHPRGEFEVHVTRTNGGWQLIKKTAAYPVQLPRLENFLKAIENLSAQSRISGQDLLGHKNIDAEFGFDLPLYTIVIQQGDVQRTLKLGSPTPPGDEIYAQVVGGAEGIDLISADFRKVLPDRADDWRNTVFVNLEGLAFDHLHVANGDKKVDLSRESTNGFWRMDKPTPAHADAPKIKLLLDQLQSLRRNQFVTDDPGADLEPYGLQPPRLELSFDQGTNQILSLQFGKSPSNDDEVYARVGGESSVVLVSAGPLVPWHAGPDGFRDQHLITHGSDLPDSIEVSSVNENQNFAVQFVSNAWRLTDWQKTNLPVDIESLTNFVDDLYGLTNTRPGGRFALDAVTDQDLQSHGLATPLRRYLLTRTVINASGTNRTVIAQLDFGTNADSNYFARRSDLAFENSIYAVNGNDFSNLPPSALQLRDRQIWKFDPANIAHLAIETNGVTRLYAHEGTNIWPEEASSFIRDIGSEQIHGLYTEQLVEQLGTLKAEAWFQRGGQLGTNYGFSTNSIQITLEFKNNEKVSLIFGGVVPGVGILAATKLLEDGQVWLFLYSPTDATRLFDLLRQMQTE